MWNTRGVFVGLVLLKMTINISQKLSPEQSLYYKCSFSLFGTHFGDKPKILICHKHFWKTFFAYKLFHKNIKVNHSNLIVLFFWRLCLIKDTSPDPSYKGHISGPLIWIGLSNSDTSPGLWWCEDSFFFNYSYSKIHHRRSIKKDVLKNFVKFTRKHLCQSLFFHKVAGLRPAHLLRECGIGVFLWILRNF